VETCTGGAWGTAVSCPSSTPNCNAGVCGQPASCQTSAPGTTTCGASGTGSCCASPEVPGGEFYLTYTNSGTGATGAVDLATLHGFRLDAYNVTVGRFRQFVAAWNVGYNPPEGSGIHAHLNGGLGLVNSAVTTPVTYETGWDATDWNSLVTPTNDNLFDGTTPYVGASWTASQGGNEMLPIDYVSWYEAYAFCIWDGGFLPSEAEWQFAAAGGGGANGQLEYPWGSTPPGMTNQYAIFGVQPGEADPECYYPGPLATCSAELAGGGAANIAPVGYASLGIGAYGQFDLLGSVLEWTLDWDAPYTIPCTDCSYLTEPSSAERVMRSSTFLGPLASPWTRTPVAPAQTQVGFGEGFRCARSP
jgi:formylglycine-generating enzyme required for sulfatase activity